MVDIKEIKSIKLAPFTLMSSAVSSILAFIGAILYLILFSILGAFMPTFGASLAWLGVALVIILPISAFFIGIATNFYSAFVYNKLVPRLGGVKLGMDGSDVVEVPILNFALILAAIETIWAFIIGLFLAAAMTPLTSFLSALIPAMSQAVANATNTTGAAMPTGDIVGAIGVFGALFLIIGLPIIVFVVGFIGHALAAFFYNAIATKVAKIKLEFAAVSGTTFELKTIPVVPVALAIAVVMTIFGLIMGLINLISLSAQGYAVAGIMVLIYDIVMYFIQYFIIAALAAFIYNFLVPRIGGIELDLE